MDSEIANPGLGGGELAFESFIIVHSHRGGSDYRSGHGFGRGGIAGH